MRMVFTGGGTGGHIFPNIAVINELRKVAPMLASLDRGANRLASLRLGLKAKSSHFADAGHPPHGGIFYIGEKKSFEEKITAAHNIPFFGIHAGKLRRYWDFKNIIDAFKIPLGIVEAVRILRKLKPDLIFAKGGYVSVPVVFAARMLKIPVWLHESDVSPGLATKLCSRFAEKIWLSFEESRKFFLRHKNVEVVGNPIRAELLRGNREMGFALTGFSPNKPVLLVIGGSTGAATLNRLIFDSLPDLLKKTQVVHITGETADSQPAARYPHYKSFQFLNEDLAHIYAIADLAISRAGSGSIFEFLALGKPMILIPLTRAASRGDQIENARIFERHGWAVILDQDTLSKQSFLQTVFSNLSNTHSLHHKAKNPFLHATETVARAIINK